ncbi:MAG: hypothetical protein M3Y57_01480 [Acidobacteriota bacterium]|nr:hypothetical protein [Acidobacteriota bacterium]
MTSFALRLRRSFSAAAVAWAVLVQVCDMRAELVPVRHIEGTERGFLELRTQDGRMLAVGDLIQVVQGERVTSHLVFHFKDGSLDDETTVFTQRGKFRLVTDRHIQKGRSFPNPMDVSVDAASGKVTVRSTGRDGKKTVKTDHLDLPPDLANGVILTLMTNIRPDVPETDVPMVVATPKPRLIKLAISPAGEDSFSIGDAPHKATRYVIKIQLGGIAGLLAPLLGKQPKDIQIWILEGEAPAFVKEQGQLYQGGPVWNVQLASPVWPRTPHPSR